MLSRIFQLIAKRPLPPKNVPARSVPDGVRVYAIGDIHGRLDLLQSLHRKIKADAKIQKTANKPRKTRNFLIYLGDYIDRGLQSRQVIDCLLEPISGFKTTFLMGNHEERLLAFLDDPICVGAGWFAYGGVSTVLSYGCAQPSGTSPDSLRRARDDLERRVPPSHLKFFRSLELYKIIGDYAFVHAGILPGRPMEKQTREDLLWIRDEFLMSKADHGRTIVHGHTIVRDVEFRENRICIDTGALASGCLTCLVLEGCEQRIIQ